jgi:hypothetical protein
MTATLAVLQQRKMSKMSNDKMWNDKMLSDKMSNVNLPTPKCGHNF